MAQSNSTKVFTGRHMAGVMIAGFGIVAAVNFTMASYATKGFHGVVVDNSYVASQKFNTWLDKADKARQLGWVAQPARDEHSFVVVTTEGVPVGATMQAQLRRPIGTREYASLEFLPLGDGVYRSDQPVEKGRWTIRLTIEADGKVWSEERELP